MSMIRRLKWFQLSTYWWAVTLIVQLAASLPSSANSFDFQECEGCHDSVLKKDGSRKYLHDPFKEKECGQCHAATIPDTETVSDPKEQGKINWLGEITMPATHHALLLPGDGLGDVLLIDVERADGVLNRQEMDIPPLVDLAEVEDSGKAPTISGLQVLQIQQGVFLSAKIGWQTDTITDALVRYGDKDLSQASKPSMRLGRQHQVILNKLQANRIYHFTAVSRDLFGRSQVSEPLTFSTSNLLPALQPVAQGDRPKNSNNAGVVRQFHRLGTDYLLELTLETPSLVIIGSRVKAREEDSSADEFHEGLSSKLVTSMKACLTCHVAHLHPLNVSPKKPDVKVPPEFPTLSGGRITCTSCHSPHSSDYYFHLRKPIEVLCSSCHQKQVR